MVFIHDHPPDPGGPGTGVGQARPLRLRRRIYCCPPWGGDAAREYRYQSAIDASGSSGGPSLRKLVDLLELDEKQGQTAENSLYHSQQITA